MTDILYSDGSDASGTLGAWRYNHGDNGWAFNEYSWMPNQPGNTPLFNGMNRLMGDGSVNWKPAADFPDIDQMINGPAYPGPSIGGRFGDTAYF